MGTLVALALSTATVNGAVLRALGTGDSTVDTLMCLVLSTSTSDRKYTSGSGDGHGLFREVDGVGEDRGLFKEFKGVGGLGGGTRRYALCWIISVVHSRTFIAMVPPRETVPSILSSALLLFSLMPSAKLKNWVGAKLSKPS